MKRLLEDAASEVTPFNPALLWRHGDLEWEQSSSELCSVFTAGDSML